MQHIISTYPGEPFSSVAETCYEHHQVQKRSESRLLCVALQHVDQSSEQNFFIISYQTRYLLSKLLLTTISRSSSIPFTRLFFVAARTLSSFGSLAMLASQAMFQLISCSYWCPPTVSILVYVRMGHTCATHDTFSPFTRRWGWGERMGALCRASK